jgi:hypothetical protein
MPCLYRPDGISPRMQHKTLYTPSYLPDVMPTFLEISGARYPSSYHNNTTPLLPSVKKGMAANDFPLTTWLIAV